jgi:hypothetical protein
MNKVLFWEDGVRIIEVGVRRVREPDGTVTVKRGPLVVERSEVDSLGSECWYPVGWGNPIAQKAVQKLIHKDMPWVLTNVPIEDAQGQREPSDQAEVTQ